eukprot:1138553-Pelagomonas_calceolata.AAC.3
MPLCRQLCIQKNLKVPSSPVIARPPWQPELAHTASARHTAGWPGPAAAGSGIAGAGAALAAGSLRQGLPCLRQGRQGAETRCPYLQSCHDDS